MNSWGYLCMHMSIAMHTNYFSVIEKTGNTSTGTTLSTLKIYSRCLIQVFKVKYTEFKISYFTTVSSACWSACLPAVRPSSTMARAPVFSDNKGNRVGFTKLLFPKKVNSQRCDASFILYKLAFIFKSLTEG